MKLLILNSTERHTAKKTKILQNHISKDKENNKINQKNKIKYNNNTIKQ